MTDEPESKARFLNRSFLLFEDRTALQAIGRSLRRRDPIGAAKVARWWWASQGHRFSLRRWLDARADRLFDRAQGVDTSMRVELTSLTIDSGNLERGVYYQASPVNATRRVLRTLGIRHQDFVFIDFGSGKGRVLMIASELPWKAVIGIEFARELHEVAVDNIARYGPRTCAAVSSVCIDATEFSPPAEHIVAYFYNPFDGVILARVLQNLATVAERDGRTVLLVYHYPANPELMEKYGFLCQARRDGCRVYRWSASTSEV